MQLGKLFSLSRKKNEVDLPYELVRSNRAKRIRLTVYRDGKVRVTIPRLGTQKAAERFVEAKQGWIREKQKYYRSLPKVEEAVHTDDQLRVYKKHALLLIEKKLPVYNAHYGFSYKTIRIKNQKTLWGSCSKRGSLNFNYKIALLPERLADYIIVHELCHLKEFNHSRQFWDLVGETVPDYIAIRKELRKLTLSLS